ncbi:outer membrane protein assembly factor BamE [Orbaceae bacterium ESL0721]|nr:outer membrane protein assembly factor BamE [Orbaceae bacterium ESL0721]
MQLNKFIKQISTTAVVISCSLLVGCSMVDSWVYRPDINQGNYVTQNDLDKLQIGLNREQVKFIMGTPMLTSELGDDVWYYVFRQQPRHDSVSQHTYIITFDKTGRVSDIKAAELEGSKSLQEMDSQVISDNISHIKNSEEKAETTKTADTTDSSDTTESTTSQQ